MRTFYEIIVDAKENGIEFVTKEELYYALLVSDTLHYFANYSIRRMASKHEKLFNKKEWRMQEYEEEFKRTKRALNQDPKKYMGENVPGNKSYDRFVEVGKKIWNKIVDKKQHDN